MDSTTLCTDRYLITLSYKTMLDSEDESAGRDISFGEGKRGVNVRVTNRLRLPLTPDNLQSLSLSIPGLHTRLNRTLANIGLFHYGNLLVYNLPPVPVDNPDGDPAASLSPPRGGFYVREDGGELARSERDQPAPVSVKGESMSPGLPGDSTSEGSPDSLSSGSEDFYTCPSQDSFPSTWSARWGSATGSPLQGSPNLPCTTPTSQREELVSVEFKGKHYVRVLSRAKGTDAGVEATWTVTDFTEQGGVQVFSLRLDFMRPRPAMPRWMEGIVDEEYC